MTRAQYIEAVLAKLEEISPFAEPDTFIAADGDSAYANAVKPIKSYVDKSLNEAAHNCLRSLPLSLLHGDISTMSVVSGDLLISDDGVGVIYLPSNNVRPVRFHQSLLKRDITAFITTEDPIYILQQNLHTRGKVCKPVVAISSRISPSGTYGQTVGTLEIYSFPQSVWDTDTLTATFYYIDTNKKPDYDSSTDSSHPEQSVNSPIEEYIILECAAMVSEILNDANSAQLFRNQLQEKVAAALK